MHHITSAGVIVYRLHNAAIEYLLLKNAKGHWDFPKGKQEKGESIKETAHRELFEEAGITATLLDTQLPPIHYTYIEHGTAYTKTVFFFIGQAQQDATISLSREHTQYCWLPYSQAYNQLKHINSRSLLAQTNTILEK